MEFMEPSIEPCRLKCLTAPSHHGDFSSRDPMQKSEGKDTQKRVSRWGTATFVSTQMHDSDGFSHFCSKKTSAEGGRCRLLLLEAHCPGTTEVHFITSDSYTRGVKVAGTERDIWYMLQPEDHSLSPFLLCRPPSPPDSVTIGLSELQRVS